MIKVNQKSFTNLVKTSKNLQVSGLRAITAQNSNAYTNTGTQTYLIGSEQLAIIDPGPNLAGHFDNIIRAIGNARLTHIVLTHSHQDHCALAVRLAQLFKVEIYMFGTPKNSNYELIKNIVDCNDTSQSIDSINKNLTIKKVFDGEKIFNAEWCFEIIFTPGHHFDHICLAWEKNNIIFSGDHVMGWSSTMVAPPSGHMGDFISSLEKLLLRDENIYLPTHGEPILDAKNYVQSQLKHRKKREEQILAFIKQDPYAPAELVPLIYKNLISELEDAAAQNVFASLIYLSSKGFAEYIGPLSITTKFFCQNMGNS